MTTPLEEHRQLIFFTLMVACRRPEALVLARGIDKQTGQEVYTLGHRNAKDDYMPLVIVPDRVIQFADDSLEFLATHSARDLAELNRLAAAPGPIGLPH